MQYHIDIQEKQFPYMRKTRWIREEGNQILKFNRNEWLSGTLNSLKIMLLIYTWSMLVMTNVPNVSDRTLWGVMNKHG